MATFGWVAAGVDPPWQWDLRRVGWRLAEGGEPGSGAPEYPLLTEFGAVRDFRPRRERMIVLGVDRAEERARLLAEGFADALCGTVGLAELGARAQRVYAQAGLMPRRRQVGPVTLDLYHRDALVAGRWIGLFPREFELFWRLSEQRGVRVTRSQLLKAVWRLEHDPGTNRVEVHVSRLRAKLAFAGTGDMIGTDPAGGYFVRTSVFEFAPAARDDLLHDAYVRTRGRLREKG
ncbi:MAG TPA: winged helix-turn-helix domain-containing protein [Sphingomonadaceae bacterium]